MVSMKIAKRLTHDNCTTARSKKVIALDSVYELVRYEIWSMVDAGVDRADVLVRLELWPYRW